MHYSTSSGEAPKDQRGKHSNRPNKLSEDVRQKIHHHIESFRGRQSHYSRDKSRRIYLPDDLNVTKMFTQFTELHPNERLLNETYRNIFNTNYNISFGYPHQGSQFGIFDAKSQKFGIFKTRLAWNNGFGILAFFWLFLSFLGQNSLLIYFQV